MMTTIPISGTAPQNEADFYFIQFSPTAIEWRFLVTKLLAAVELQAWNDYIVSTREDNGHFVYMLKKERYSAKVIADHLGTTEEYVINNKILVLDDIAVNADLPKATVDYWGTA